MKNITAKKMKEAIDIINSFPYHEPEYMMFTFEGKLYKKDKDEVWEIEIDEEHNFNYIKRIK